MIEGGCFCGAIRYELTGPLAGARACHCSRCRKAFSGASSTFAWLAEGSELRWVSGEGELSRYASKAGWGIGFCQTCGSTLCGLFEGRVRGVTLGCVDGDPGVAIGEHLFVGSKAPWDHIGGDAPQHEEWPPG